METKHFKQEGLMLEYKSSKNELPKDFWKTYSAFCNTNGGLVVLGIDENKNNEFSIGGVTDSIKIKKDLFTLVSNNQKVNYNNLLDEDVYVRTIEGKEVIEISIKEAPSSKKPVYLNQNITQTFKRINDGDRMATPEELKYMIRNSSGDLDSELLPKFDINDLNFESIESFRTILVNNQEHSPYISMDKTDLLIEVGAMKKNRDNNGEYCLTVGGLLFFGKYNSITDKFPHFHLDYFNRSSSSNRWIDRVATGDPKYPNLNLFSFFQIVLEKLKATVFDEFQLQENSTRNRSSEDVEIALREALANTLIHADYFCDDSIKIETFRGHYIFHNPGNMKISIEEFVRGGDSKPRNNTIATLFRRSGFCERAGSGGPKIFQAASRNKLKFPDLTLDEQSTTIKLWKIDIVDAHEGLTQTERTILKYIVKKFTPVSSLEIQTNTNLSRYYVTESISSLIESGLITQQGKGRSTKYTINEGTSEYLANLQHLMLKLENYYVNK